MQVANALNNNIRILFNPKIEAFKLFDFLIVKSTQDRYLAQIIEIYDDKFDASQNVAKLKLFYKISLENEVMPYDNFTPNKECEIVKINQHEIENFINQNKKVFQIGLNAKDSTPLNIQYAFFDNNPVILSDKIESSNTIFLNLAKNLSSEKHTIIIDATGTIEYEEAKKIKAAKHFKLPLNYETIDYVFDKCLDNSTLKFQSIGSEILNEIKKFAKKQPGEFIPFTAFNNVLVEQYKATPYPELRLLVARLKKYQMDEIFARTKKDLENPLKIIEKNPITIIDISTVHQTWQKVYLEYVIDTIKSYEKESYVITRLNDENFDVELINNIYKNKNINFIPSVSYSYKKLPSLMQHCNNYILMPSLYQRMDFLDANFALGNLISDGCIIFGQNTDNFLYIAKKYELEIEEKKTNYRKISLSEMGEMIEGFNRDFNQPINQAQQNEDIQITNQMEYPEQQAIEELSALQTEQETSKELTEEQKIALEAATNEIKQEIENDIEAEQSQQIEEAETLREFAVVEQEYEDSTKIDLLNDFIDEASQIEQISNTQDGPSTQSIADVKIDADNVELIEIGAQEEPSKEIKEETKEDKNAAVLEKQMEDEPREKFSLNDDNLTLEKDKIEGNINFSDEELDFFEITKESETDEKKAEEETKENHEDINLSEIANDSINDNFEEIINQKKSIEQTGIALDENTTINLNVDSNREDLPIFDEKINETKENDNQTDKQNPQTYNVNDKVSHSKYGIGTIVKIIGYEDRQLLQIRFEESGPKLLDPKVANIELVQE